MISVNKVNTQLANYLKTEGAGITIFKHGDLVDGKMIKKAPKAVYFDLGPFGTGIVYGVELMNAQDALKDLKLGDATTVKIIDTENDDGYVELSLREVGKQVQHNHRHFRYL